MNPITSLVSRAAETAAGAPQFPTLAPAAWDLASFLTNAASYVKIIGGGALILMGIAALVWGGILLLKKLMGGQQNQDSWVKIILLIIIGGAISVGGFAMVFTIGSGGKKTIEDLGGATFLWDSLPAFGPLFGLG